MPIVDVQTEPFAVPLLEPFTISRASVTSTRAVLVRATLAESGRRATGLGEAALPLGDPEEPADLERDIENTARALRAREIPDAATASALLDAHHRGSSVSRSALHCALLDAVARLRGEPLFRLFGPGPARSLETDITLPIAEPAHLAALAEGYWARGFRCFKVKVGSDLSADRETVDLVSRATPGASLRFDANEGFDAESAVALLTHARDRGMRVECFEQPCRRDDLDGMRHVRSSGVPVVADEGVRSLDDLERHRAADAVDGVNLKLVKMGGIDRCLIIGRAARAAGLGIMVGAMIESRLGLSAMAHAVAALGGAEWVDLDTAFLLARDPCQGGMSADGATLTLSDEPGLGITV